MILLKFIINDADPDAYIQEMEEIPKHKFLTRVPLAEYREEDFEKPEVIISRHIPYKELSQVISVSAYKNIN